MKVWQWLWVDEEIPRWVFLILLASAVLSSIDWILGWVT